MMVEQNTVELTSSNKYIKHICTWNNSHRILTEQGQKILHIQSCKNDHHVTGKDEREKKKKKEIGIGPEPLGGTCERRKVPLPWELPSTAGRSAKTDRALRRLREKYSRWLVAGRTKKDQHRWS